MLSQEFPERVGSTRQARRAHAFANTPHSLMLMPAALITGPHFSVSVLT